MTARRPADRPQTTRPACDQSRRGRSSDRRRLLLLTCSRRPPPPASFAWTISPRYSHIHEIHTRDISPIYDIKSPAVILSRARLLLLSSSMVSGPPEPARLQDAARPPAARRPADHPTGDQEPETVAACRTAAGSSDSPRDLLQLQDLEPIQPPEPEPLQLSPLLQDAPRVRGRP